MVRVTGFAPAASWTRTTRSTKLSYTLMKSKAKKLELALLTVTKNLETVSLVVVLDATDQIVTPNAER